MAKFSDQTYKKIGMNLALGMSQDAAVASATGRDKVAVNKYAYQVCKHDIVQRALEEYSEQFQKQAFVTKEMLEAKAAEMVFGRDEEGNPLCKASDQLGWAKFIGDLNGLTATARAKEKNADTRRGEALVNMANKINGNMQ